jgi:hypothetical protein
VKETEKQALETIRNLSLQLMLISAGVFGIVGGLIATTARPFDSGTLIILALLCFALSGLFGYFVHGSMIGLLNKEQFDPHNHWIQVPATIQFALFLLGGVFFIFFVGYNLPK